MNKLLLIIITILLPPLGVYLKTGVSTQFWINLVLALLVVSYPLGIIHGLWIQLKDG